MKYQSTRGGVSGLSFKQAVMMGLAEDGGLLVPEALPDLRQFLSSWQDYDYPSLAAAVMSHFIDDIDHATLLELTKRSYGTFDDPLVTPLSSRRYATTGVVPQSYACVQRHRAAISRQCV